MSLRALTAVVLIAFGLSLSIAAANDARQANLKSPKLTGTFSSLQYNQEGGDLLGAEIRISYTKNGYQGTFQFSEGEPDVLVLVDIHYDKDTISFEIPKPNLRAGTFTGKISDSGIAGRFDTSHEDIRLKRGKSYWD